ncbi:hypothetical protein BC332_12460 [Capsicum chinense]|nr:hypothetical protein BC332_12460 [Capsicum chinense]
MQLQGTISSSLANLSFLSVVNLENNSFHGGISFGLGHLTRLRVIDVRNNQLEGSIPTSLFQHQRVQVISLAFNKLGGEMWKGPWFVPLAGNRISGNLPKEIGNLSQISTLTLYDNQLIGTIPASLANISTLQYVSCTRNRLEGSIPPESGKLSNLRQLSFGHNYNLIGQIPEAILNISSLERIAVNFNNLSGTLPTTTGLHLPNLEQLFLGGNQLEGEIPLFITNASKLEILEIASNYFTGTFPNNLGNLRELQYLFLYHNQLTNEPRDHELQFFNSLVDCRMLGYLEVGHNPLNGVLPNSIGNLSSTIEDLDISNARINGLIPPVIGNMSGLTELTLGGNNLMRNIPPEIGKLKLLQGLFLPNNKLNGHIPQAVCHLSNLVQLSLGDNELLGLIPACIGNLSMLQQLYLGSNRFSSKFPSSLWKMRGLLILNASQNSIEGEVPRDIGGLKAIVELYLFGNHFSVMIPSRLGELQNLQYLDLSNNSFFGQIPFSFAHLISLEFLDLSLNALSGTIPKSMERLSYHKSINVSFNDLEGEIPSGGVFVNSALQSFLGNRGLCGVHISKVHACANPGQQSNSGSVYKGTLSGGIVVAIKILDLEYEEVCQRFDTECEVKRNVRHRNLVSVITTCSSDHARAFVLQYMSNGSLENWLYREDCQLNLLPRVTVMLDAAMRIEYLHHGHITPIVHCDLKPANILLDDMVAHVGDFGISKILAVSPWHILRHWALLVISHQVLTKRRPTDEDICNENLDLRKWITQSFSGTMLDVVDGNLFPEEEQITSKSEICIASMIELALDCTKETPESRITMKDVAKRLNKIKNTFLER